MHPYLEVFLSGLQRGEKDHPLNKVKMLSRLAPPEHMTEFYTLEDGWDVIDTAQVLCHHEDSSRSKNEPRMSASGPSFV